MKDPGIEDLTAIVEDLKRWTSVQAQIGLTRVYMGGPPARDHAAATAAETTLAGLRETALKCVKCPLSQGRTHVVFGSGNEKADLMFVGEGPGFDEDQQGVPFVGRAGQLLTKMINGMGLTREDVYIANIVKCRPPQNRAPRPEEIDACLPYLLEQIEKIRPRIICALGAIAAQTLLQTDQSISRLRGMFHEGRDCKIMPTFHPAYLLRNPEAKREVWHDLQLIMKELGLKKP